MSAIHEPVLRALLGSGTRPATIDGLRVVAEAPAVPWRVRLHERAAVDYSTHLVVVEKDRGWAACSPAPHRAGPAPGRRSL